MNTQHTPPRGYQRLGIALSKALVATLAAGMMASTQADVTLAPALDSTVPMPGAATNFKTFDPPGVDTDGRMAFLGSGSRASGSSFKGIYLFDGSALTTVATYDTEIPDAAGAGAGIGNFALFQEWVPSGGGAVAFKGYDPAFTAGRLYSNLGGPLRLILGESIPVPDRSGAPTASSFTGGNVIGMSTAGVVVRGFGSGGERGFYEWSSDGYRILVDDNDELPGGRNFEGFNLGAVDGDDLVIQGLANGVVGVVHVDPAGTLRTVADTTSPIPGGTGNFTNMWYVDIHGGEVAFRGQGSSGQQGVYAEHEGTLLRIADLSSSEPAGTGGFTNFGDVVLLEGRVAFLATRADGTTGLYSYENATGTLEAVLATGESLDGRTITSIYMLTVGGAGEALGISVHFSGGFRALHVVGFTPSNEAPVANAGLSIETAVGETVYVSGLGSTDDTTPTLNLRYSWTLNSKPAGSRATIGNSLYYRPYLRPDMPGLYTVQLVVTDQDGVASAPSEAQIGAGLDPAFIYTKIFDGHRSHYSDANRYATSEDQMWVFDAEEGQALFLRYSYSNERDYSTGEATQYGSRSIDHFAEGELVKRFIATEPTETLPHLQFYDAAFEDADTFRFQALYQPTAADPRRYALLEAMPDEVAPIITIPRQEDGYSLSFDTSLSFDKIEWLRGTNSDCFRYRYYYYYSWGRYRTRKYCVLPGTAVFELTSDGPVRVIDNTNVLPSSGSVFGSFSRMWRTGNGDLLFTASVVDPSGNSKTGLFRYSGGSSAEYMVPPGIVDDHSEGTIYFYWPTDEAIFFSAWYRSDGLSDSGVFELRDGVVTPKLTARTSPLGLSTYFQTNGTAVAAHGWGAGQSGPWWLEDGVLRNIASQSTEINGVNYHSVSLVASDWRRLDTFDGRSVLLSGNRLVTDEYDSTTGVRAYEYENDIIIARFDTDRDGRGDDVDNCPKRPNEDQADVDGNGIGDVCEDSDNDGTPDVLDNCPLFPNENQANDDGDRYGNACDLCPDTPGESQADQDGNGVGDLCDPDIDGDGYDNDVDNCPTIVNDQFANLDGDAEGDACDLDIDGDGIDNRVDGRVVDGAFIDESEIESDDYTDAHRGGLNFGRIINRDGLEFRIYDSPDLTQGLLAETLSGAGQLRIKACDLKGPPVTVDLVPDSEVPINCGSIEVAPARGHAFMLVDEAVLIHTPAGTSARILDTNTSEILLEAEAVSGLPVTMVIDEDTEVIMEGSTLVHAEPGVTGQYIIENDATSLNPITVVSGGNAIEYAPGDLGLLVGIDIKPGSEDNTINLGSNGVVSVAILSAADFDATDVDPLTVRLASSEVRLKGKGTPASQADDVNDDGIDDLVVQLETENLVLSPTDTQAKLTGMTFSGMAFIGQDSVALVPAN